VTVDASERPDDQKRARRESRTRHYVIGAYVLLGSGFLLLGVSLWLAIKFQHDDKTEASVGALFGGGAIAISVMAGGWALLAAAMADLQSERADLRTQLLDKQLEILGEIGISQSKALTAIADVVASDAAPPTTEEKPGAEASRQAPRGEDRSPG
jgi:hypothetical protein